MELPLVPLKKVVLEYLRSGCAASGTPPACENAEGALTWQFFLEDTFEEAEAPTWVVSQAGACEPDTDTANLGRYHCPIEVRLIAPISATAEWVQEVQFVLDRMFNGVYHVARETVNLGEYTPLGIRLTDVALAMGVPLYCRSSTNAALQQLGMLGERLQLTCTVSIFCNMTE